MKKYKPMGYPETGPFMGPWEEGDDADEAYYRVSDVDASSVDLGYLADRILEAHDKAGVMAVLRQHLRAADNG